MSIILGVGIAATATTITVFYLGKKGWQALHKAVGITPGVLVYQDANTPLSSSSIHWQQLRLDTEHLSGLPEFQLLQLQRIDEKVAIYDHYQQTLEAQNKTAAVNEEAFVLHKLLYIRLPEMLASYYHLLNTAHLKNKSNISHEQRMEASQLLQDALDNIERRSDTLLTQIETQHLQDLRTMKRYLDSHNN